MEGRVREKMVNSEMEWWKARSVECGVDGVGDVLTFNMVV